MSVSLPPNPSPLARVSSGLVWQVMRALPEPTTLVLEALDDKERGEGTQSSQAPTQDKGGKRAGDGDEATAKRGKRKNKENVPAQ